MGFSSVVLLVLATACHREHKPHDHGQDHPTGHDHHAEDHGHGDTPTIGTTLWGDAFEFFSEHSPGEVGHPVSFLIHLTKLSDFRALEEGTLELELDGPASLRAKTSAVLRPGIFRVEVTPEQAGTYRGRVRIEGPTPGVVEGIELRVFDSAKEAAASASEEGDHGVIEFLKEQQWGVPFGTAFVEKAVVVPSVVVSGRIDTPPGGSAVVGAPVTGRLVSPAGGLPRPGTAVRRGQVLASLIPAPASPEAAARATLAVTEAHARLAAADRALERAERLIRDEAISQRALEDARREKDVAQESVNAALRGAELYSGARGAAGHGTWHLTAPIGGTLVEVLATPGATVSPGATLFRIIDTRELWVVARVPEQDAAHLRVDHDASFKVAGRDTWSPIKLTGEDASASVVTIGRTVDPISRTVEAIYSLASPGDALRVGGLVQVNLPAGQSVDGVTIPRSALIDQDGRSVVYVQADGEHFEERAVRTGPRAGNLVAIVDGLRAGERIVTRGAHLVRLADKASGEAAHGHIH
jgi:RND family efflux transporter MFP subunit